MLTRQQIAKAARLMDQVGDLRPGFLLDGTRGVDGPTPVYGSVSSGAPIEPLSRTKKKVKSAHRSGSVKFSIELEKDPVSGEVRITLK